MFIKWHSSQTQDGSADLLMPCLLVGVDIGCPGDTVPILEEGGSIGCPICSYPDWKGYIAMHF